MAKYGVRGEGAQQTDAPEAADVAGLADNLKALANGKRLRLLQFLVKPHYLEEIASELMMARQTAQEHVQQLLEIGVIQRLRGRREHGPVTDYVVVPQRLFSIQEEFSTLGVLQPELAASEEVRPLTRPLAAEPRPAGDQERPRLTIVHGMRIGQTMALVGSGPWLIGRDPHASCCLDYDPFVSSRHAEVRKMADGFEVADLYSSNGTAADWKRLSRGGTQRLQNGTVVRVGKTLLLFREST